MNRWIPFCLVVIFAPASYGDPPRVLPTGERPKDARLGELKTLNDHFPFEVVDNAADWYQRAESLRRRVLVATGLWPMPEKPPLNAVVFGKTQRNGFTVEKVYFESLPGHFVTGLLFRPSEPAAPKAPGVLCPHGHGGRMQTHSDEEIARQIASGGEHFEQSGRTPKLARCAQLARMGCVSFIFDMLGYADSVQISHAVAHRHSKVRPEELERQDSWVFYSVDADLRHQSIMGLQTWNAIRALDFLESLPDVDPKRLAVTGGSGGGTQSILLGAIDERIKVSFPNGMVSTSMQGGCYCENCNLLRIDTGNVELAALFAPRPQAMTAADDWTRDMMTDGYPQLQWLYAMLGNESDVYCRPMLEFKHNYNYVARATMYQWMNRHLKLGLDDPIIERDFRPLSAKETTIWDTEHPAPDETGIAHERSVCRWFNQQATEQLAALQPTDQESLDRFRESFGGGWSVVFDQWIPEKVVYRKTERGRESTPTPDTILEAGILEDPARGAALPLLTVASTDTHRKRVAIWTGPTGKAIGFEKDGRPNELLRKLIARDMTVLLPDLLDQGEFVDGEPSVHQRVIDDTRPYSAFTFGYNRTLAAHRAADLLAVISYAKSMGADEIVLLGTKGSAAWVAPAAANAGASLDRVLLDTGGFRFNQVSDYRDPDFVPGAAKYGDLPNLLALRAPHAIGVLGESDPLPIATRSFRAAGAANAIRWFKTDAVSDSAIDWLTNSSSE